MKKKSYRDPVQYWAGYQTFVNRDSKENIKAPEELPDLGDHGTAWPVNAPRKREKQRALPLPSSFPKDRQKNIERFEYNTNTHYPARTKGQPGEERGNPTKYDYNYPTRRTLTAYEKGDPGSTRFIKRPSEKQKNQKGVSKRKSQQEYLHNKNRLKSVNRKRWLKKRRDPDTKRQREYYRQYPNRYKRKGFSPFTTPAERTKAWREENKEKNRGKKAGGMCPADCDTFTKKTESPGAFTSMRAPNLWDKPQKGLFREKVFESGGVKPNFRVHDQTNGSGKVFPRDSDLLNNKRVYKEEEINPKKALLKRAKENKEFRSTLIRKIGESMRDLHTLALKIVSKTSPVFDMEKSLKSKDTSWLLAKIYLFLKKRKGDLKLEESELRDGEEEVKLPTSSEMRDSLKREKIMKRIERVLTSLRSFVSSEDFSLRDKLFLKENLQMLSEIRDLETLVSDLKDSLM